MFKFLRVILVIILLCLFSYQAGINNCQIKTVTKEKEVIKYVMQQKAKIQAQANVGRDELLKLMHNNRL